MPEHHKYCVLSFDEMAIGPGVSYDKKKDILMGLVSDGHTSTTEFCDHALVFMLRGAVKKFKQPLAYYFCHGSTKTVQLKAQIETVIKKVQETGLQVIATVCDQGASNIAAVNQLVRQTREKYLRTSQEIREDFFEIQDEKIYPIFDPPHLIKGIRNNLITKNLKYVMGGKVCVAKWEHIVALYNRSPGYKGVKLVPKLTAQHVLPDYIPKMRVKHCTQVFSKSVGVALGYMAGMRLFRVSKARFYKDIFFMSCTLVSFPVPTVAICCWRHTSRYGSNLLSILQSSYSYRVSMSS